MTLFAASTGGSRITKANQSNFASTATVSDPLMLITADVYEAVALDGGASADAETTRRVKFKTGQIVRQSVIDAAYAVPSNVKITVGAAAAAPTALAAAGGDVLTITADRGLTGVSSVTFGGTAGTSLTFVSDRKITVVAPAKTAGAVALVIVDDSGSLAYGNVTYV
jgi:hypothetical protein